MTSVLAISKKFSTKKKCYDYLEKLRWNGNPICPNCNNDSVTKRKREFRFHCNGCNGNFSVLSGTIFEDTRLPLQKWFILIQIVLNARKGISSKQLSRDLAITYKTAWYCAMRLRCAMIEPINKLTDVVEMDEVYIGGKPRKRNHKIKENEAGYSNLFTKVKRGRGADKIKVVGIVQRGKNGRVYTKMMEELSSRNLLAMLKKYVDEDNAALVTDEFKSYKQFDKVLPHFTVNHSKGEYSRNGIHTNTIEGYWSIIKNGIRGQYHVLSKKYLPFYLAEFAYKYNRRSKKDIFEETIKNAVCDDKCTIYYKPKRKSTQIAYPRGNNGGKCSLGSVEESKTMEALEMYAHIIKAELKKIPISELSDFEMEAIILENELQTV